MTEKRRPGHSRLPNAFSSTADGGLERRRDTLYERTAPQMSSPQPPHVDLTLAGTLLVTVARRAKGQSPGCFIRSTRKPEVSLSHSSSLVKASITGSLSSGGGEGLGRPLPLSATRLPKGRVPQIVTVAWAPTGSFSVYLCPCVCRCTCGSQRTTLSIISWPPSTLGFETRLWLACSPLSGVAG